MEEMDGFDKRMGRWVRKEYGTKLDMWIWRDEVPDFTTLNGQDWDDYCAIVWDTINDKSSTQGKELYPTSSGFYNKKWQTRWIKKQYDKVYDQVEATCIGSAGMEVETLGMSDAKGIRAHLLKQFGGAGDDVRTREERYQEGMPKAKGQPAFPPNVNVPDKLRELNMERVNLWKMCREDKRT